MKKKFIVLISFTFVILLYDAADLFLYLVFNITNEGIDITAQGLVCILMCVYPVFFLRVTYDTYSKKEEKFEHTKIDKNTTIKKERVKINDRLFKAPEPSGHTR